jgi:toxin ParE1/3/4
MAAYKLSKKAKEDIANAYEYGIEIFGLSQAKMYLAGLNDRFQMLTDNVNLGRVATGFNPRGLRRFRYESHIIFYLPTYTGILVIRVLNHHMDMDRILG